jgi:catechol 2,3-dioxygenase-like lactoylglutathione lyase family enzyme
MVRTASAGGRSLHERPTNFAGRGKGAFARFMRRAHSPENSIERTPNKQCGLMPKSWQMVGKLRRVGIGFYEFKGVERTPFRHRVRDPGTPAIALRVTDLDRLVARMRAAGTPVISAGGVPAQFSPTIRNIFVEDPSGFKIELYEQK